MYQFLTSSLGIEIRLSNYPFQDAYSGTSENRPRLGEKEIGRYFEEIKLKYKGEHSGTKLNVRFLRGADFREFHCILNKH